MNRIIISFLFLSLVAFTGCNDDFLERFPLDELSPQTFFNSEAELRTYTNSFYSYIPTDVWNEDLRSDNVEKKSYDQIVAGLHTVETSASSAGWTWSYLRNVNFFLANYNNNPELSEEVRNHYAGVARFFRAWFYFDKVKRFGDVPWYDTPLGTSDESLYKARDSRTLVMDNVLADLDFAYQYVRETTPSMTINKWVVLALKSRVALFEGTFRKYHGITGYEKFLTEAKNASKLLMDSKKYSLYTTNKPASDYLDLFAAAAANKNEMILARVFVYDLTQTHTANGQFLTGTLSSPGLTKDFTDTYLMKDGKPFTAQPGYDTMTFYNEMQNRDPRLAQTIRTPGYKRIGGATALAPDLTNARTGYQIIKFVTGPGEDGYNANTNDLPVFRYAEVLLNYAEALAELGQLTQTDLDLSVNLIRKRAGMPNMDLATLTVDPVLAAKYPNVSGGQQAAILEIRRERRVELAMEGFRYYDLLRWKAGSQLAVTFKGMYFPSKGNFDLDQNGTVDIALVDQIPATKLPNVQYFKLGTDFVLSQTDKGNIVVHPTLKKVFDETKHYYFPLPRTELLLNTNLTQNPGWN